MDGAVFNDFVERDPFGTPLPTALETHSVESSLRFSCGRVEVRKYTWAQAVEDVWAFKPGAYLVNMALSPRPAPARIVHLGLGRNGIPQDIGRVLMIPPGSKVRVSASCGRLRSMHCGLDSGLIEGILNRKPEWDAKLRQEAVRLDSPELEWLLLKMYHELRHNGFARELAAEAFAHALCIELIRRFRLGHVEEAGFRKGGLAPWRMRLVRERAYADAPAPSLKELADLCDMTVRQLGRVFKAETGQTIGKFVEAAAVERARVLLTDRNLSVGEIASKLGFASSSSFADAFRRATGLRPSEIEGRRRKRRSRAGGTR